MSGVRVIGASDLAREVHAALSAAAVDARLVTTAPPSIVADQERDGSDVDVVVRALDACAGIKKASPHRPVVAVVDARSASLVGMLEKAARGPDAHVVWPASAGEIVAACERAKASAGAARPQVPWQLAALAVVAVLLVSTVPFAIGGVVRGMVTGQAQLPRWSPWVSIFLGVGLLAIAAVDWRRARTSAHPWRLRAISLLALVLGVNVLSNAWTRLAG